MRKILYLSYDGLTDPLGQSQIIPYLRGLAKLGHSITIVSFEKNERQGQKEEIKNLLIAYQIEWVPLSYTKTPPVLSTLYDLLKLRKVSRQLVLKKGIQIIHCRSYLTALVGQWAKKSLGTYFIFDMRGFWADERVEGKLWHLRNPVFWIAYKFFKKKEKEFLEEADHTITLTNKAREIIHSWNEVKKNPIRVTVIPCCVDLELFQPDRIKEEDQEALRQKLGVKKSDFILMYLGSLGTWYMLDEMLAFYKVLKERNKKAKFLFVTKDSKELVLSAADKIGVTKEGLLFITAKREDVPLYVSLSTACIYFIKPTFSKQASSPTKHGEILAMNKHIVTNKGVGDFALLEKSQIVDSVDGFDEESYNVIVNKWKRLNGGDTIPKNDESLLYFNLNEGIKKIDQIYNQLP